MKSDDVYPIWYQKNRPFAKQVGSIVLDKGLVSSALEATKTKVSSKWNEALTKNIIAAEYATTDFLKEISLAFYYGAFSASGKQIFVFTKSLGEMLANTSAEDVPISCIKSPYESYFIQFHSSIKWGKNEIVGAYIIDNNAIPTLQICLVLKPNNMDEHWMSSPAGYFFIPLEKSDGDATLSMLIDKAIDAEIVNKWEQATKSMPLPLDVEAVDKREQRALRESMDLNSAKKAIHKALSYTANCLCYLVIGEQDSQTEYPSDTSQGLLEKLNNAKTPKAHSKAKSKLAHSGYVPITYVGRGVGEKTTSLNGSDNLKREHWRRGHWRNQVHGEGRSGRKLIWIKPTLVGNPETSPTQEQDARIYRVKK